MRKILFLLALIGLTACESAPAGYTPQPLSFSAVAPMKIDVSEVRIVENYQPSTGAPNVDQDFPNPPASAVKQWVKQRLSAVGSRGVLEVSIDDASVHEIKLPKTQGIKGLFTNDQDTRYEAKISVTMRLFNGEDAMSVASGDVVIMRSRTIDEDATVDQRQKLFDSMTHEMMTSFDQQAVTRLKQYFAAYVK